MTKIRDANCAGFCSGSHNYVHKVIKQLKLHKYECAQWHNIVKNNKNCLQQIEVYYLQFRHCGYLATVNLLPLL